MTFATAISNTAFETRTENGMKAVKTSTNPLVDLFYTIGASRGKDIIPMFESAFQHDATIATKIALWARDVRGGAGERQTFRNILTFLESAHPDILEKIIPMVPELGRWDDLLVFKTDKAKLVAYNLISDAIKNGNQLCAKWLPRKGLVAIELRKHLRLSPKQYRKTLVNLTNVVETPMCAKEWDKIEFGKIPSLAAARYQSAFKRNATDQYSKYIADLSAGKDKVNAGAVYPHDVLKTITSGEPTVAIAQWDALPNFMGDANVLPMVDVSGSMYCPVGNAKTLKCIDVAVALGLYCADKNTGAFKDAFLTFSEDTQLEVLNGNIVSKYNQLSCSDWGMNTNLHKAFESILEVAVTQNVVEADMPKTLLILSDMQFDECISFDDSAIEMISRKYNDAGYARPNIVFWNLHASNNMPVSVKENGTALISGFSPSIMKSILSGEEFTPESIMMTAINNDRYNF